MTRFMQSVMKRVIARRRRVHRMCNKIVEAGGTGGKYYIPQIWKEVGRSIR